MHTQAQLLVIWPRTRARRRARRTAQVSDGVIKIGVLNDQSSLYADLAGAGLGRRGAHGGRGLRRREARA